MYISSQFEDLPFLPVEQNDENNKAEDKNKFDHISDSGIVFFM